MTHSNVIIQLNSSGRIELDLFQCLSDHIVRLSFAGLSCFHGSRLIYVALVINVELAEGILETEDLILFELRIFPIIEARSARDVR